MNVDNTASEDISNRAYVPRLLIDLVVTLGVHSSHWAPTAILSRSIPEYLFASRIREALSKEWQRSLTPLTQPHLDPFPDLRTWVWIVLLCGNFFSSSTGTVGDVRDIAETVCRTFYEQYPRVVSESKVCLKACRTIVVALLVVYP